MENEKQKQAAECVCVCARDNRVDSFEVVDARDIWWFSCDNNNNNRSNRIDASLSFRGECTQSTCHNRLQYFFFSFIFFVTHLSPLPMHSDEEKEKCASQWDAASR